MLDPRPPLDVADAEEEPEEVGVGASVWMENICSDEEDWAMTTGSSAHVHDVGQGIQQLLQSCGCPSQDLPRVTRPKTSTFLRKAISVVVVCMNAEKSNLKAMIDGRA
jgi:hypothetical protein